jgi:MBG domain (YGX type)
VNGSLSVTAASLTITAKNASKTYGQTLTFAGTEFTTAGLVNSDAVSSVTLTSTGAAAAATVAGGPYAITPSAAVGTGLGNYNISYVNSSLTVTAAPLTIAAKNLSKTYGQTFTFTGTEFTTTGLVNNDTVSSMTLASAGTAVTATVAGGPYAITPSAATGTGLSNYNITYVNGSLTVSAAALSITAKNASKTYGQILSFSGTEFTTTGLVNTDTVGSVSLSSPGAVATATVAGGPYAITPSAAVGTGLGNYNISYGNGSVTVNPATLTVMAKDTTKTYGQTVTFAGTEFTTAGLVNSDSVTSVTLTSAGAAAAAGVGSYAVTPSAAVGTGLANYNISYGAGSLTVNAAPLTITAKNASKTYGQTLTFAGTEFTATGLVNSDAISGVTLTSTGVAATATVAGGQYAITPSAAVGTGLGNYNISYVNGSLTISAAPLTITAKNASKTYGQTLTFAGTEFTASGLLNSDTVSSVALASAGAASTASVTGSPYLITASSALGSGLNNYTINYISGSLTVNPATLTLSLAGSGGVYIALPYPAACSVASGLVNADSVTLSIGYSSGSAPVNVGKYTATCTSSGNANYQTATAETAIVITPATLSITAKNQSMTFGGATPTFAADFAGLMGTDTSAVVSGLSFITYTDNGLGTSVSNYQTLKVGPPYPIVPGGGTAANYIIQYVNGSLTVNKATLTGSVIISPADPQTVPYGKPATATVYLNSYSIGGVEVLQAHNEPTLVTYSLRIPSSRAGAQAWMLPTGSRVTSPVAPFMMRRLGSSYPSR